MLRHLFKWTAGTAGRYCRFAGGIASRPRTVGRENIFEIAQPINAGNTVQVELDGELVEFSELIEVLRIGDRVRVFCDDGVIEAEKISPTRFKLIYAAQTSESIQ
jgi:hypothetical protein